MESSPQRVMLPLEVLVVDDDPILAEYVGLCMEQVGCNARTATSAAEALRALDDRVELLVTDWKMPGMDGMALVQKVRNLRSRESYLHIVMLTAGEDAGAMKSALHAGVDDFLRKPVDRVELEMAVATARRNRMMQRRLRRRNQLLANAHARTRSALRAVREDLDAAAALHERLLPRGELLDGVAVGYIYQPALMLGGDTIGVTDLGDGKTLFFLIDVRGHGVPAALESFHLHHRLKQFRPETSDQLEQAAALLNAEIAQRMGDSYATMVAGLIDANSRECLIVRAGHPPPLLARPGSCGEVEEHGAMPLGWFETTRYKAVKIELAPGDRLVVYSDGVLDCVDQSGAPLTLQHLERALGQSATGSMSDLIGAIEDILGLRNVNRSPVDDVSLLAIELAADRIITRNPA